MISCAMMEILCSNFESFSEWETNDLKKDILALPPQKIFMFIFIEGCTGILMMHDLLITFSVKCEFSN